MPPQQQPSAAAPGWRLVQWDTPADIRLDRAGHTATVVGTSIIIAGGRRGSYFYNDVLVFDMRTSKLSPPPRAPTFPKGISGRANHTATLVGSKIWFIGGGDVDDVFDEVFTLDVNTWAWQVVAVSDPHKLLQRTAHGAEVHPAYPSAIILTAGYGPDPTCPWEAGALNMLNDVVLFDTQSCSCEQLVPLSRNVQRRAHHSMAVLGDRVYVYGGKHMLRQDDAVLIEGPDMLGVFDLTLKQWQRPAAAGTPPSPRSSLRAVALPNRIVMYGSAPAAGSKAPKQRTSDLHSLVVLPDGQLLWSSCDSPPLSTPMPPDRNAHSLSLLGDTLYVVLGYRGLNMTQHSSDQQQQQQQPGSRSRYTVDCWTLQLRPDAVQLCHPAALAEARGRAAPTTAGAGAAAGQGQAVQSHKRHSGSGAAAAAAAAGGGARPAAAVGACAGSAAGGEAAVWRTVKRQRSGGKDRQPQPQPQPQQQQPQQRQAGQQAQAGFQQQQQQQLPHYSDPPQGAGFQQGAGQQQQQQVQRDPSLCAAAAVAAEFCQLMVGAPGSRSPMRAGSPLRDSFGNAMYLQAEVDGLRDKLQDSLRQVSSLEAEVRLVHQQLAEAKAEARQDKQQREAKLQEQQMELARQQTLLEAANVGRRRAQEDAAVAQQDLGSLRQALQKAELERDAAQQQLQGLHAELRKQRAQHSESDQEVRRLQLQVQQQAEQARRLQEQAASQQQRQEEERASTRASIEQQGIELRRLNDTIADQKQKYEAQILQHQQAAAAAQDTLQATTRQLLEVQKQLEEAQAAGADARKQRDDAVQLQVATREQLNALGATHKAALADKARLEAELSKAQDGLEAARRELEQRRAAGVNMQAALQQLQTAMQTVVNASSQLTR